MNHNAARSTSAVGCVAPATQPSTSPRRKSASAKKRLCAANFLASFSLKPFARRSVNSSAAAHSRRASRWGSMISTPEDCNARTAPCEAGRSGSSTNTGATTRWRASSPTAVSVRSSADSGKMMRRCVALARTRTESRKLTRGATSCRSFVAGRRRRPDERDHRSLRRSARPRVPSSR